MHTHVIVAVKKTGTAISHVRLESGSVLTQDDCEHFIRAGCEFVARDTDGNTAKVVVIESGGNQYIKTVRNDIETDNLDKLPLFE